MTRFARLALLSLAATTAALAGVASNATGRQEVMPGVTNPAKARIDYMLKCQGCHQANGASHPDNTPPLAGEVARFLSVDGGREFLARVPGVASIDLDDQRLTDVLNWTLYRFDPQHVPADFKPYTEAEIARLRQEPLRLEREGIRAKLVAEIDKHR